MKRAVQNQSRSTGMGLSHRVSVSRNDGSDTIGTIRTSLPWLSVVLCSL
jgi:hypothetical protein